MRTLFGAVGLGLLSLVLVGLSGCAEDNEQAVKAQEKGTVTVKEAPPSTQEEAYKRQQQNTQAYSADRTGKK